MSTQVTGRTRLENGLLELEGRFYSVTSLGFEKMAPGYVLTVESFRIKGYELEMDAARAIIAANSSTPPQYVKRGGKIKDYPMSGNGTCLCLYLDGALKQIRYSDDNEDQHNFGVEYGRGCYVSWRAGNRGLVFVEICKPPYKIGDLEDLDIDSPLVPDSFRQVFKSLAGF